MLEEKTTKGQKIKKGEILKGKGKIENRRIVICTKDIDDTK